MVKVVIALTPEVQFETTPVIVVAPPTIENSVPKGVTVLHSISSLKSTFNFEASQPTI